MQFAASISLWYVTYVCTSNGLIHMYSYIQMKSPRAVLGKRFFCKKCYLTHWRVKHQCEQASCLLCRSPECQNEGDKAEFVHRCRKCNGKVQTVYCISVHVCNQRRWCKVCMALDKIENFDKNGSHVRHCGEIYCGTFVRYVGRVALQASKFQTHAEIMCNGTTFFTIYVASPRI